MEYPFLFALGAALYVTLELFWRGRSHVSMAAAGGVSLVLLYGVFTCFPQMHIAGKCAAGALVVTAVEYITGALVNVRLGLRVWDYSNLPFNLYGQICLPYSLLWAALCAPVSALVDFVYTFLRA